MEKLSKEESRKLANDLGITKLSDMTDTWVGDFLTKLNDPVKKAAWDKLLDIVQQTEPEQFKRLNNFAKNNKGMLLEFQGWEGWLKTLGAKSFDRDFAPIQHRFWDWNWRTLMKARKGVQLEPKEMVGFLPWSRETGKSTHTEWACIAEGALLRGGYVIFYAGKQAQAEEHVTAIRDRIESEHVSDLYPWLGKPKVGAHGNKYGWGKEFLLTSGGWAIRPVGADVAIRGGKTLNLRPTLIVVDDLDELGESPLVVEHKEAILTRSILPMGNDRTRVLVPQNPIHANSVINRMLTNVSMALAVRTIFGELEEDGSMSSRPVPAVRNFAYEVRQTDDGPYSQITEGQTNWPGIELDGWERTLNRVGPPAFLSEYQHDMTVQQEERVLPEYDDRNLKLHVITWSQFEALYKLRRIPSDWPCSAGLDIGYTGSHKSAWTFITKVPQAYQLSGCIFRYRGRTFTGIGIDEQAISVRSELWSQEQVEIHLMSHEKLGERLVLNQKHGWHFQPCESAKTAGIAQWRHFLAPDRSQPHPFHRDEKGVNGLWKLGRPAWFDIVADDQYIAPRDDQGLKRHRDGAYNWRQVPVKLTEKGLTVEQPAKVEDDENDSCFVAGTMITTQKGDIPIENISENDVVLTRQGWKPVESTGMTSENAEIWTIILSNGCQLSGTRVHPIWVAGYGWKPLSEIGVGERLLSLTELNSTVIQTQSIGHTERISSPMYMPSNEESKHYTSNSGRWLKGHLQRGIPFTTSTTIHSITLSPIWSPSPAQSTVVIMGEIVRLNILRGNERIWRTCKSWLKSGIEVKRGESGIEDTRKTVFSKLKRLCASVTTAVMSGWRDHIGIDFAQIHVNNGSSIIVTSVKKEVALQRVYNLAVKDTPEYFANGILVHNCRMLLTRFGSPDKPMTRAQQLEALIPAGYHKAELAKSEMDVNQQAMTSQMAQFFAGKLMKARQPKRTDEFGNELR